MLCLSITRIAGQIAFRIGASPNVAGKLSWDCIIFWPKKRRMLQFEIISTYQDLESVEKGGRISDASVLVGGGVVLRDVTVLSGAQEHLLDIQVEAGTEVLDGVHVDAPVDGITWGGGLMALFNNISTFKNLNCMALHAISVFGKV